MSTIIKSETPIEAVKLAHKEAQIVRHYDNQTITASELRKLDCMIMERIANFATDEP